MSLDPGYGRREQIVDEEWLRQELRPKNKLVGLPLTFLFPFFGLLYSHNYLWALLGLMVDVANLLLLFVFGLGFWTGLLWRLLATAIANSGIDRYRRRRALQLRRQGFGI